jgi:Zn-finger domain-containing protein
VRGHVESLRKKFYTQEVTPMQMTSINSMKTLTKLCFDSRSAFESSFKKIRSSLFGEKDKFGNELFQNKGRSNQRRSISKGRSSRRSQRTVGTSA